MRTLTTIAVLVAVVGLVGCSGVNPRSDLAYRALAKQSVPVIPPTGLLYSKYSAPVTSGPTNFGEKVGKASSIMVGLPPLPFPGLTSGIDIVALGDASSRTAAKAGGIRSVEHVDYEMQVILLVFYRFTTVVYGN